MKEIQHYMKVNLKKFWNKNTIYLIFLSFFFFKKKNIYINLLLIINTRKKIIFFLFKNA